MPYQQSPLVTEYIARYDAETQRRLQKLRNAIQVTFPNTIEDISYGIPTYRLTPTKRGIVHFGAAKGHIGIYGIFDVRNNAVIHEKMQKYRTGRGTLQFSSLVPLPMSDIRQILIFHKTHLTASHS